MTTSTVDANGKRSDVDYDALGRVTKVWGPGRSKADHPNAPATQYSYTLSRTLPNVVTTKELNHQGEYLTSYTFYDGLLRPRQTQSPAVGTSGTGRVVTETRYDTRGQAWKSYDAYHATGAPSATLVAGDDSKVPSAVESQFDGAGRPVAQISLKYGDETKRTTTIHDGDRISPSFRPRAVQPRRPWSTRWGRRPRAAPTPTAPVRSFAPRRTATTSTASWPR